MYDIASSILQQKIAQVKGVGDVNVGGGALPAVRVDANPTALNHYGLSLDDLRTVLNSANANRPKGTLSDERQSWSLSATDQLLKADQYRPLIIAYRNGGARARRRCRYGNGFGGRYSHRRARQRQTRRAAGDLSPAWGEHHRHRRPDHGAVAGAARGDPAGGKTFA